MKKFWLIFFILFSLSISSFKSSNDALCGINYNGVDSQGCNIQVVGTYDCNSANPISTFSGTISFSGSGGCLNMEIVSSVAMPDGDDGWAVPPGYDIAFYTDANDNFCNARMITFIGANSEAVSELNKIGKSILAEFQSDMGC